MVKYNRGYSGRGGNRSLGPSGYVQNKPSDAKGNRGYGSYSEDSPSFARDASFLKPTLKRNRAAYGEGATSDPPTRDWSGNNSAPDPQKQWGSSYFGGKPFENTPRIPDDEQG